MLINKINLFEHRQSAFIVSALVLLVSFCCLPHSAFAQSQWTTNGNTISNTNTGNVGIGTTNPLYGKLQVNKTIRIDDDSGSLNGSDVLLGAAGLYIGTSGGGSYFQFNAGGGLDLWQYNSTWAQSVTFAKTGRIGIGTNAPNYKLDVQGGQVNASGGLCIASDCKTAWSQVGGSSSQWTTSGSNIFYNSGNAGIGTTSPTNRLTVIGDGSGIAQIGVTGCAGNYVGITLAITVAPGGCTNYTLASSPSDQTLYINRPGGNAIRFRENNGYSPDQMIIASGGNVGIGTSNPTAKLDVQGNVNVSGNINAKYQDVAEWVSAAHAMPAGTVVVLNPAKSNQVMACAKSYDTRVAGVISTMPGIALGEAGADKVLVATTGRVKLKVDATRAPINVGDLLVTSDKQGMAMKSVAVTLNGIEFHRPGTLIGKALEPLEKGTGEILVLLSLQ
jgi:hypothetical protein